MNVTFRLVSLAVVGFLLCGGATVLAQKDGEVPSGAPSFECSVVVAGSGAEGVSYQGSLVSATLLHGRPQRKSAFSANDTDALHLPESLRYYRGLKLSYGSLTLTTVSRYLQDNNRLEARPVEGKVDIKSVPGAYLEVRDSSGQTYWDVPLRLGYDRMIDARGREYRRPHIVLAMTLDAHNCSLQVVTTSDTSRRTVSIFNIRLGKLPESARQFVELQRELAGRTVETYVSRFDNGWFRSGWIERTDMDFTGLAAELSTDVRRVIYLVGGYLLVFDRHIVFQPKAARVGERARIIFDVRAEKISSDQRVGGRQSYPAGSSRIGRVYFAADHRSLTVEVENFSDFPAELAHPLNEDLNFAAALSRGIARGQFQSVSHFKVEVPTAD